MEIKKLRDAFIQKDKESKEAFLLENITTDILWKVHCVFWDNKKSYNYWNNNIWHVEYKEESNNVIIEHIWSINSRIDIDDEKINWLWSFIFKEFIENSSYEEYIFKTITMSSRKFYFKIIRRLLKDNIISEVSFIRDSWRKFYNQLDDEMKEIMTHNHAFSKIIIKK